MKDLLRGGLRLVIECCALYLLSVALLLLGVYWAMSSPLLGGSGMLADLPLLGIMQVYDLALLGVLGYLFARPERREDGYYVAMAAALLLLDPTFFNNRMYGHGAWEGLAVNGACLLAGVAKVAVLAGLCRVPLPRGTALSLVATMAFLHLGPAAFVFPALGGGDGALYALSWMPLALAFLAPTLEEFPEDPDDLTEAARVRAGELRLVLFLLPYVGVGLHLWELSAVYGLDLGWVHLGPWLLAAPLHHVRLYPEDIEDAVPVMFWLGTGALVASLQGGPADLALGPLALSPLRVTLLGHVAVGAYMALRFDTTPARVHALTSGLLAGAGATPEQIAQAFAGPYGWSAFLAAGVCLIRHEDGFRARALTWVGAAGLTANLVTGEFLSGLGVHLAGGGLLALLHAYPEVEEDPGGALEALPSLLLAHAAYAAVLASREPYLGVLLIESTLVLAGAAATSRLRYRVPSAGLGVGLLTHTPLGAFLVAHKAGVGLAGSFLALGGGLAASAHKEDLLERLGDREDGSRGAPEAPVVHDLMEGRDEAPQPAP